MRDDLDQGHFEGAQSRDYGERLRVRHMRRPDNYCIGLEGGHVNGEAWVCSLRELKQEQGTAVFDWCPQLHIHINPRIGAWY